MNKEGSVIHQLLDVHLTLDFTAPVRQWIDSLRPRLR